MLGFGSFGADPFADDDDEEAPEAVQEEEEQPEEQPEEPQEEKTQELPTQDLTHEDTESSHVDEGVELIADDEDTQHDYSYASAKDTIIEEEEPADDADSSDALAHQEHLNLGQEDADDSAAATADSLNVADEDGRDRFPCIDMAYCLFLLYFSAMTGMDISAYEILFQKSKRYVYIVHDQQIQKSF